VSAATVARFCGPIKARGIVPVRTAEERPEPTSPDRLHKEEPNLRPIGWTIPVRLRRTEIEKRLLIDGASNV
jgi:site-specific DNA recombinase